MHPTVVDPLAGVVPRRLLQAALDQALVFVAFFTPLVAAVLTHRQALVYVAFVTLIGLSWILYIVVPARTGATPGMRLTGLRIVTTTGGRAGLRAYGIRWVLMVVDGALFGLVGAVLIAATPRHQRLGDMLAGTLVIRSAPSTACDDISAPAGFATPR
jgi:uncharacterized RDD family membrane protein YckC